MQVGALLFEVGDALVVGEFAQDVVFFGAVFAQQAALEVGGECGFCFFEGGGSAGAVFARGGGVFFGGRQGGLCGGVRGGALFEAGELFALVAQGVVIGAGLLPAGLGGGEALFFAVYAGAGGGERLVGGFVCAGKGRGLFVQCGEGGAVLLLGAAQGVEAGVVGVKQRGALGGGEAFALRGEAGKGGLVRGVLFVEAGEFGGEFGDVLCAGKGGGGLLLAGGKGGELFL